MALKRSQRFKPIHNLAQQSEDRSEERRVGKECRYRWARDH